MPFEKNGTTTTSIPYIYVKRAREHIQGLENEILVLRRDNEKLAKDKFDMLTEARILIEYMEDKQG